MTKLLTVVFLGFTLILNCSGCATKLRAYRINSSVDRKGGIPFFLPKPILRVNEPIEAKRQETLYALISLGGVQLFLFRIDTANYATSIQQLKSLINVPAGTDVELVHAPGELSFQTKNHTIRDESTKRTTAQHNVDDKTTKEDLLEENAAIPTQSPIAEAEVYQAKDLSKSYNVFVVPDYSKEYELVIDPSKLASSKMTISLTDGMLTSINLETGENKIVESLTAAVQTVLTTLADVKKAEIGKAEAIELARLAPAPATTRQAQGETKQVAVTIVGYVKEIKVAILKPGLYDISSVLTSSQFSLPTEDATYWRRVTF